MMPKLSNSGEKDSTDSEPISLAQTTPRSIGPGHPEYQFVQSVLEMQKHLGEIHASIRSLEKSVDKTNNKIDCLGEINSSIKTLNETTASTKTKVEDLVNWKNKLLGAALTVSVIFALIVALTKIFDIQIVTNSDLQSNHTPAKTSSGVN